MYETFKIQSAQGVKLMESSIRTQVELSLFIQKNTFFTAVFDLFKLFISQLLCAVRNAQFKLAVKTIFSKMGLKASS